MASTSTCNCNFPLLLLSSFVLILASCSENCHGQRTFGFDVHHRFSDPIRQILPHDHLPEKGSLDYYRDLAHRDRIIRGRRLSGSTPKDQILSFVNGNTTYRMTDLGYLHYANVSLGTPSVTFFVALDTGSDIFWVPASNCNNCSFQENVDNSVINVNYYNPNASSTSKNVPCNSNLCEQQDLCLDPNQSTCPYDITYVDGSFSYGNLVEDVLHLATNDIHSEDVNARITFGCPQNFANSDGDPFGIFGLGVDKLSVPSILSNAGLTANSFSMCFGPDGIGSINFGDKGSPDQAETSFTINQSSYPHYYVSVTQITVETNTMNASFTAFFDTGTSFTYLKDPAYTLLTRSFNAQIQDTRHPSDPNFEYCYDPASFTSESKIPTLSLTMGSGSQFRVYNPTINITATDGISYYYCLAVIKTNASNDNVIGQNFMTDYVIVFDRERSVLGWKNSDCYDAKASGGSTNTNHNSPATPPPYTPTITTPIIPYAPVVIPSEVPPEAPTSIGDNSSPFYSFSGASSVSVKGFSRWNHFYFYFSIFFIVFFNLI